MTVILNFLFHPHLQVKESCNNLRYTPETPSAFKMDFALRKLDEPVKVENRRWDSFVLVSELVEFAWVVSEVWTGFTVLRNSCSALGQGSRTLARTVHDNRKHRLLSEIWSLWPPTIGAGCCGCTSQQVSLKHHQKTCWHGRFSLGMAVT